MADNTISPVVPNVSGGRTVSTGQKAITQTSAQSGIDFKSYLGGRTAVQDNSTTFLKRRNSYTLNKNNTKEISIKTASKNSHTESEVKKITDDISSQIVEKVTDDLDISEDELNNAMQLLGLTAMDLLNPANLSALYCEVTGNASDPQALVLNADFTALFNDVSEVASENDAQLDLLSQLTASDDGEILDADIVSSADTTDATESTGSVNTPEKTVDSSYDDTAASGQNINDTADEAVKVYDGGTQDSSYQNPDEGTSSGETGNGITSDEKTQSKSLADSSFDDSGERVLHHDDGTHSDNSMLHASVSEQLNTDTSFEMSQSQSRLRVDTTNIIRQIVDSMSISNTTEESAINLQLTPESLGRMYINVSQKNSEISARIAVSNEAVKEALQTQMVNLKEALNNSGIRVNEVEITVASHEFERNLEQGAANDSRQQESTNSYNGSNSSDSGIDSDMMQDRVEERLVTQIMRDNRFHSIRCHEKGGQMAITANVTNGKLDKTNTTPTQNRKTSSAKASGSNLGYDDFLKLLSAEMQYQDPLEPTSNTDYVAQMATFSQLEATLSMKESMSSSYDQTTKSAALSLVGKEVIVTDKDSASGYYSGKVDYVTYKDGKIQLSINEKMYDYSSLYSVSTDEYYDAIVNSSTFSGLIAKLPKIEDLTIDSKGSIEEARKLYDGLSDYGKQFINASDYSKLQAYEDKLKELIAADKNNQADSKENDTNQTA